MTLGRVLGGIGRTFISVGVLILLFVAYQLWGTNLAEARSQDNLAKQFDELSLQDDPQLELPREQRDTPPAPPDGTAVARIKIPKIGLEKLVVEGVGVPDLKKGPGHYPTTPMPGQVGNAAIAGHRTTYGAPFYKVDELVQGDKIFVTTAQGRFEYHVIDQIVVSPSKTEVLDNKPLEAVIGGKPVTIENRLTLTTCDPRFSAARRRIVHAQLIGEAKDPVINDTSGTVTLEGEPDAGLSGRRQAEGPAIAWGASAALVWLMAWIAARRFGKWIYAPGVPIFMIVLFFFFENFSRLLPANF